MTQEIHSGRFTAAHEGQVVVFLIGMRVNRPLAVRAWSPVFTAMPRMLKQLSQDPDSGMLGWRGFFGLRTATLLQYWDSVEKLQAFAGDPAGTHRPAWVDFFRDSFTSGAVGIWHETFVVPAGRHESIYTNLPATGLAAATGIVPVARRGETARQRLGQSVGTG